MRRGLSAPDAGRIQVLGFDPLRDRRALQLRIGVQLQEAQLQKRIKVWEAVAFWRSLHPTAAGGALLRQLGLHDKRDAWFMTLSGGQKQRLFIPLALVNDPEIVLLDELMTGLDPQARGAIPELVRGIRDRGKTVFRTPTWSYDCFSGGGIDGRGLGAGRDGAGRSTFATGGRL